jgi:hypothetical protein
MENGYYHESASEALNVVHIGDYEMFKEAVIRISLKSRHHLSWVKLCDKVSFSLPKF